MKSYRRAVLHVGPPKSGSTAIQSACHGERAGLRAHGVCYPLGRWHPEIGSFFCEKPEGYIFNVLNGHSDHDWLKERDKRCYASLTNDIRTAGCHTLVLSYEGFVDLDENALAGLRDYLEELSDDVVVLAYCRPPLATAISTLSQRVKFGRVPWNDAAPPICPYEAQFSKFLRVFGKQRIAMRNLSRRTLIDGDVVTDFLHFAGLPPDDARRIAGRVSYSNSALSREAMLLGEKIITRLNGRITLASEFTGLFGTILEGVAGAKAKLTPDKAVIVLAAAKPHSAFLRKNFGISFESEDDLIDEAVSAHSPETFDSLAAQMISLVLPSLADVQIVRRPQCALASTKVVQGQNVTHGQTVRIEMEFVLYAEVAHLVVGLHLFDELGRRAFGTDSTMQKQTLSNVRPGAYRVVHILQAALPAGRYTVGVGVGELSGGDYRAFAYNGAAAAFQVLHRSGRDFIGYADLPAEMVLMPSELDCRPQLLQAASGHIRVISEIGPLVASNLSDFEVEVMNNGPEHWEGDRFRPVSLCYHWRTPDGHISIHNGVPSALPKGGVPAGATVRQRMAIRAPSAPGAYVLELTLLQDGWSWFENLGFKTTQCGVAVVAPDSEADPQRQSKSITERPWQWRLFQKES